MIRLASQRVLFSHAYTASPLCQPSRSCIITGLYPSQTGFSGNQSSPINEELRDEAFMNRLQQAGYYNALIGKHHYIDRYNVGINVFEKDINDIKSYGFDYLVQCLYVGVHTPNAYGTENVDDYIYYKLTE